MTDRRNPPIPGRRLPDQLALPLGVPPTTDPTPPGTTDPPTLPAARRPVRRAGRGPAPLPALRALLEGDGPTPPSTGPGLATRREVAPAPATVRIDAVAATAPGWQLDEHERIVGRRGVAAARALLAGRPLDSDGGHPGDGPTGRAA